MSFYLSGKASRHAAFQVQRPGSQGRHGSGDYRRSFTPHGDEAASNRNPMLTIRGRAAGLALSRENGPWRVCHRQPMDQRRLPGGLSTAIDAVLYGQDGPFATGQDSPALASGEDPGVRSTRHQVGELCRLLPCGVRRQGEQPPARLSPGRAGPRSGPRSGTHGWQLHPFGWRCRGAPSFSAAARPPPWLLVRQSSCPRASVAGESRPARQPFRDGRKR